MACNGKKTKRIRDRKHRSNKINLKTNAKRIQNNTDALRALASKEQA
ncbi:MAG: hypothetical protein U9N82_09365 [Thermodesulfobacteriota bacterium]|nr:hypothetical protein [Thermodesulfobacteriota bacterium]